MSVHEHQLALSHAGALDELGQHHLNARSSVPSPSAEDLDCCQVVVRAGVVHRRGCRRGHHRVLSAAAAGRAQLIDCERCHPLPPRTLTPLRVWWEHTLPLLASIEGLHQHFDWNQVLDVVGELAYLYDHGGRVGINASYDVAVMLDELDTATSAQLGDPVARHRARSAAAYDLAALEVRDVEVAALAIADALGAAVQHGDLGYLAGAEVNSHDVVALAGWWRARPARRLDTMLRNAAGTLLDTPELPVPFRDTDACCEFTINAAGRVLYIGNGAAVRETTRQGAALTCAGARHVEFHPGQAAVTVRCVGVPSLVAARLDAH